MSANIFGDVRGYDKGYNKASRACYNCGNRDHLKKCCPELRCYYCGRWGQTRKVCLFRLAEIMLRKQNLERQNIELTNKVEEKGPMDIFNICKENGSSDK